jgi:hypothetical protein
MISVLRSSVIPLPISRHPQLGSSATRGVETVEYAKARPMDPFYSGTAGPPNCVTGAGGFVRDVSLSDSAHHRAVPRSSERPASSRDHWAVGRPLVRVLEPSTCHSCGQPGGESSHGSWRPYTVRSMSA